MLGSVFGTTSKRVSFAPRGLDHVAAWRRLVPVDTPLVAIGGVGLDTAPAVVAAGADAVAVISALGGRTGRRCGRVWGGGGRCGGSLNFRSNCKTVATAATQLGIVSDSL